MKPAISRKAYIEGRFIKEPCTENIVLDPARFEDHFADDQMKFYLDQVRLKVGGEGQVIVVIDACHSGTATRGSDQRPRSPRQVAA